MQDDWSDWLLTAEFAYNNRQHSATKQSPFFLEYGRHPHTPLDPPPPPTKNPAANNFSIQLQRARSNASEALTAAAEQMKIYADIKRRPTPKDGFNEGQKVWLDARNIKSGRPSKKLDVKRTGPFPILKQLLTLNYKLKLPPSWRLHPVFHISKLRPAIIDETLHPDPVDDSLRPPPEIIDDEEEYDVEKILAHTGKGRRRRFLIKWKGYPPEEATWEPRTNLKRARDTVILYEQSIVDTPPT